MLNSLLEIKKDSLKFITITASLLLLLNSCARKLAFYESPIVPAAVGEVKVKKDRNNNYSIEVNTKHLAEPRKLHPPQNTYIVWMETEENGMVNLGQLKSTSGILSQTLKGSLETVSSFKPRSFLITAENSPNIQYASNQVVLRTGSYR
jgi:hypothetical protein